MGWARELVRARTRGRVLDVGCGEGGFLSPGAVGIDTDRSRLLTARTRSPIVAVADVHALPFADATFDTAFAHRMLNDARRIDHALGEIARVLRPNGRLLVFTRARPTEGDRLDRDNGEARLLPHFEFVDALTHPVDARAALFIAASPRPKARS